MAIIAGFFKDPNPEVLLTSTTALPEKISPNLSGNKAVFLFFQCIKSVLVACPQCIGPQTISSG